MAMSFERVYQRMTFHCDVCGRRRDVDAGSNYDENRLAFTLAKEDGWSFDKLRGEWVALCPEHAPVSNY
jgi:hypothetical protein